MIALLFILVSTAIGVVIGISMSPENLSWFDYYKGGIGGIFFSGIVLHFINKRKRAKELKEEKQ